MYLCPLAWQLYRTPRLYLPPAVQLTLFCRTATKYQPPLFKQVSHFLFRYLLTVCIVVVVLCVYVLYYVGIAVFYFRYWTAG